MPYELPRGESPEFSEQIAAVYGFFAGLLAPVWGSQGGVLLLSGDNFLLGAVVGLIIFAGVMAALYKDGLIFMVPFLLAILVPFLTALAFAVMVPLIVVTAWISIPLFAAAFTVPAFDRDVRTLTRYVVAGMAAAFVVGVAAASVAGGFLDLSPVPTELDSVLYHNVALWCFEMMFLGFPLFGAFYSIGLKRIYSGDGGI